MRHFTATHKLKVTFLQIEAQTCDRRADSAYVGVIEHRSSPLVVQLPYRRIEQIKALGIVI